MTFFLHLCLDKKNCEPNDTKENERGWKLSMSENCEEIGSRPVLINRSNT